MSTAPAIVEAPPRSLWQDAWMQIRRQRLAVASLAVLLLYAAVAIYGEVIFQWHHWHDTTPAYQLQDLAVRFQPPSSAHLMGTDALGRDVLQRLVQGTRVAFQVGVVTSAIAIPIGLLLGLIAGYFGGKIDDLIVWLYSTLASIPGLLLVLAISMVVGKGILGIFLGIGLTSWVPLCRLVRAEVLSLRERPFVIAARGLGFSKARILFRHILPNVMHLVIITFTLRFPAAINTEVFMSFLGIGVQGEPSWGLMINGARLRMWQGVWWEISAVTVAIFGIVLAFNLLGDALRDALDPRLRTRND